MRADLEATIVALSTPPGPGARAVVRLSGFRAREVLARLLPGFEPPPRGHFRAISVNLPGLHSPLPADLFYWPEPHSFTGQDVVELHTISSPPLLDLLIAALLGAGARAALPGEFTQRAFLAGKLDLTRAEAVLGVIEAGDRAELKHALAQLAGGVIRPLQGLRKDLLNLLADVEAALDFADEDVQFVGQTELLTRITKGLALVTLAQRQLDQRQVAHRPFRAALVGAPNAGKSSLFNVLVGRGAALVSDEPGTTRDYLVRRLTVGDVELELVDTAGQRAADDAIERQAQDLGGDQARAADLVVLCVEAGRDAGPTSPAFADVLLVATKCDLTPAGPPATSAVTGEGVEELRQLLAERARARRQPALAPSLSRCRHHVHACLDHLRRAHSVALFEQPPEILALELRCALDQLGELVGAVYTDDLLDRIFSRFCIGK